MCGWKNITYSSCLLISFKQFCKLSNDYIILSQVVRHIQLCISHHKCHLNKRNRHFNIKYWENRKCGSFNKPKIKGALQLQFNSKYSD